MENRWFTEIKPTKKTIGTTLFIITLLWAFGLMPIWYSAEAITGTVIDGETKKPIAGAIVIVTWSMEWPHPAEIKEQHHIMVKEAVTDSKGRFLIESWGPIRRKVFLKMAPYEPQIDFFKAGYDIVPVHDNYHKSRSFTGLTRSQWDGGTFEMKKMDRDSKRYLRLTSRFGSSLDNIGSHDCNWWKIKGALIAYENERRKLYVRESARRKLLGLPSGPNYGRRFGPNFTGLKENTATFYPKCNGIQKVLESAVE